MRSPYKQLRKDHPVKIDIHPLDLSAASTSPSKGVGGKWIKPVSNAVQIPDYVLKALEDDIEHRHAGGPRAEEVLWIQAPRPLKETLVNSWAAGLSLSSLVVALFAGAGIGLAAPSYLIGTAIVPAIFAILLCVLLSSRVRCDLKGYYLVTKQRAIIVVPHKHLLVFSPIIVNFDFTVERSLIVHKLEQAGIHELVLKREPKLLDFFHTKHSIGEVTFYPRTKLQIPFYFKNIQHSHAFEMVFNDTIVNSQAPTNGGRVRIDKPSFEQQQKAAKRYKLYPFIGAFWIALMVLSVTGPVWGIYSTEMYKTPSSVALAVIAWLSVQTTIFSVFFPIYRFGRKKWEARANGRYMKFMVEIASR